MLHVVLFNKNNAWENWQTEWESEPILYEVNGNDKKYRVECRLEPVTFYKTTFLVRALQLIYKLVQILKM